MNKLNKQIKIILSIKQKQKQNTTTNNDKQPHSIISTNNITDELITSREIHTMCGSEHEN